ncbi:MAG: hypothetical protein AB7H66_08430 [Hyphomonadaceae bacterium]
MALERSYGPEGAVIELKVERIGALFDAFDPFPIPSRDLSQAAEDFIVGWARELPRGEPLRIRIHAPMQETANDGAVLREAFANHFGYRARRMGGDMQELFAFGRLSLAIGLGVLTLCVVAASSALAVIGDANLARVVSEGLLILGWVANWRPIELFLYDWWPIMRRRRLYQRLAAASVELVGER